MIFKLLNYLTTNRFSSAIYLSIAQFLPLIVNFSLILQSFCIINRGISYALPIMGFGLFCNQFVINLIFGQNSNQEDIIGQFSLVFFLAQILLFATSIIFSWLKNFEYTSFLFASLSTLLIVFFQYTLGFEVIKNFVSTNLNVVLEDFLVQKIFAMLFLSYVYFSFLMAIYLQNKYFNGEIKLKVGYFYLFFVLFLGILDRFDIIWVYVFELFGVALVAQFLSDIYQKLSFNNQYSTIIIVILVFLASLYLEAFIFGALIFGIWNFSRKWIN